jgi:transposase
VSATDPQLRIAQLECELHWAQLRIQVLEQRLRQHRIRLLGPHSETLSNLQLELLADEEPGVTADEVEAEAKREAITKAPRRERKPHPGRERLPENLPRVERVVRCQDKTCAVCGRETSVIGYDESEQLDVEPARYFVRVTKREKRACRGCAQSTVTMGPLEPRIVEKGLASDAVVIDTVVAKYCDHLPLYRQAVMLERETGLEIGRATLDGWVMRVGELLQPIVMVMHKDLLTETYLQADETTVPVQMHDGRGSNHQAYLWQYGKPGGETVFDFCLGRGREGPLKFLGKFEGILQTDGYQAYDGVGGPKLVHVGCWAHYLDSGIIRSECEIDAPVQGGSGVSGMFTPDKASQAFEEREQFRRWPPFSRCRRVKPGSLPKGLEHIALHLKIGRNVSARGGHRCMTEVISNH